MKRGKYSTPRRKRSATKRPVAMLVSLALILMISVGATIAYLQDDTAPVENVFVPAEVTPEVTESFDGTVKTDVMVENSGDVDSYVRAIIVVTWQDDQGNVAPEVPVVGTDYEMAIPANNRWKLYNGFYYYTDVVAAGEMTEDVLISEAYQKTTNGNYKLHIEILAQSIQAEGTDALGNKPIELAWGVDISDGNVSPATIVTEGGNE